MAMNPRLLRPLASGKNPETLAWIANVYAAGSSVNTATANAVDAFVSGCKADGIWDAIKSCCILCGPDTLAGALVPLVGTAPTNNNFVDGDYNRLTGLLGNGTDKELDTNRANNADPQDDKHVSVYISSVATVAADTYIGSPAWFVAGSTSIYRGSVSTNWGINRTTTGSVIAVANADMAGFAGMNRFQAADFQYRADDATVTTGSFPSGTPESGNLFVFSAGGNGYANARMAFYSIGESLDLAALDTRVSALIAAIGNS